MTANRPVALPWTTWDVVAHGCQDAASAPVTTTHGAFAGRPCACADDAGEPSRVLREDDLELTIRVPAEVNRHVRHVLPIEQNARRPPRGTGRDPVAEPQDARTKEVAHDERARGPRFRLGVAHDRQAIEGEERDDVDLRRRLGARIVALHPEPADDRAVAAHLDANARDVGRGDRDDREADDAGTGAGRECVAHEIEHVGAGCDALRAK